MLARLFVAVEAACKGLAALGLATLLVFAAMTLINGISRSVLLAPIDLVGDVGGLVVAASVSCCFPMAIWQKSNIRIDLGRTFIPGAGKALGILSDSAVLIVMIGVARQMFIYAANQARAGDSTPMLDIPTAPFWFYVAVMLAVATFTQAVVAVEGVGQLFLRAPHQPNASSH